MANASSIGQTSLTRPLGSWPMDYSTWYWIWYWILVLVLVPVLVLPWSHHPGYTHLPAVAVAWSPVNAGVAKVVVGL